MQPTAVRVPAGAWPAPPLAPIPSGPVRAPRYWPVPPGPLPRRTALGVLATVVVAAISLYPRSNGPGWFLTGLALALLVALRRPRRVASAAWSLAALALLAVGFVRDSGQLFAFCLVGAFVCGAVAAAGGRHLRALAMAALLVVPAGFTAVPWWIRSVKVSAAGRSVGRGLLTGLAVVVLVALFGALFVAADPAFADLVHTNTPTLSGREAGRAIIAVVLVMPIALGAAYLAHGQSRLEQLPAAGIKRVRTGEWAVPLAVLDLLFLLFVMVQLAVLFGGRDRVLRTAGLTYAEYARSGFWQLLAVAGLTLVVIGVALKIAPRNTRRERVLLRTLLGALAALTLVIVASALHRMSVYDDAYGYTRLRLAVTVVEIWLGVVFLLILAAGVRLDGGWLPRAALGLGVVALLAVAMVNPDRFIAERNVDRFQHTGRIDMDYLCSLSADAVPALLALPEPVRMQATGWHVASPSDGWRSWNLGRGQARRTLADDGSRVAIGCWSAGRAGV
jgi:uncharacterized protein DUF4153